MTMSEAGPPSLAVLCAMIWLGLQLLFKFCEEGMGEVRAIYTT
jgi:hypothetical protein